MVSDLDIWRAANLLIRKHGANAELEAAKRADLMLDRGDDEGKHLWARIRRAIEDLQAVRRGRSNKVWDRTKGSHRHRRVAHKASSGKISPRFSG
jgi:hypothetical protein